MQRIFVEMIECYQSPKLVHFRMVDMKYKPIHRLDPTLLFDISILNIDNIKKKN